MYTNLALGYQNNPKTDNYIIFGKKRGTWNYTVKNLMRVKVVLGVVKIESVKFRTHKIKITPFLHPSRLSIRDNNHLVNFIKRV